MKSKKRSIGCRLQLRVQEGLQKGLQMEGDCCAKLRAQVAELQAKLRISTQLLGLLETGDFEKEGDVSRSLHCGGNDGLGHLKELAACDIGELVDKVAAHS